MNETIRVVLILIAIGVASWAVNRYIPMGPIIKGLFNLVVIIATIVWLLNVFDVWHF